MKKLHPKTHERGYILVAVYMTVIFVSLFSVVFFARHQASIQATERYQNRVLAFNAAESGIDYAMRALATDAAIRGTPPTTVLDTDPPYYTSAVTPMTQNAFSFTLSYVPEKNTLRRIDATGCAPTCAAAERAHQNASITVYAEITTPAPPPSLFEYGIYTTSAIDFSGSSFDSYNSNQGAYGGSNISTAGAIAGDTTAIAGIEITNSTVKGSVLVAETGVPSTVIKETNSTVTGAKGNLPAGWTLPAPPSMASLTTPPTEINLSNITSKVTLSAGTYHTSSIGISGNKGEITTTGAVKIYCDGEVSITGQGTTAALNKPGNLHIYVTGTSSVNVKIAGNGSFYGGIFAPNSDVTFQTSNSGKGGILFGAVVSKTFSTFGGGVPTFHFDLAMKEAQPVDPNQIHIVRVKAWQEMNTLAWGTGA